MAPKEKAPKEKPADGPANTEDDKSISMETELLISFLRSKMGRYQELGERLQLENFKLHDDLSEQKLTLDDINEFLTAELKARSLANAQLEERAAGLAKDLEETRRKCEADVARARSERQREAEASAALVDGLQRAAAASGDWVGQREALEAALAAEKDKNARMVREHEARIIEMERQVLADKERWRKETAARIRDTKAAMAQLADNHLEATTKRTILENDAMAAELGYHAAASGALAAANTALRGEAAALRRELASAEATADALSRKNLLLQRTIKAILGRLREEQELGGLTASLTAGLTATAGAPLTSHGSVEDVPGSGGSGVSDDVAGGDGTLSSAEEGGGALAAAHPDVPHGQQQQQQQQQQRKTAGRPKSAVAAAAAAADVISSLEQRVLMAAAEWEAARTALAAAVGGLAGQQPAQEQEGGGGSRALPTAAVSAAAAAAGVVGCSGAATSPGSGSSSPTSPKRWGGAAGSSSSKHRRGGRGPAAVPRGLVTACDDGVAPFALWCVSRLRHKAAAAAGGDTQLQQQHGASHVAQEHHHQQQQQQQGCNADGRLPTTQTPSSSSSRGLPGWEALPASAKEALAQFLLEQLHSYTPAAYAAYQGLYSSSSSSTRPGGAGASSGDAGSRDETVSHDQQQQQQRDEESSPGKGAAAHLAAGAASSSSRSPGSSPTQRRTAGRPALQLPPLPGSPLGSRLLSPGVTGLSLAAAGVPASPGGDVLPGEVGIDALLAQVLGEVRPWGGSLGSGAAAAGGGRLRSPGKAGGPGALGLMMKHTAEPQNATGGGSGSSSVGALAGTKTGAPCSSPNSRTLGLPRMGSPLQRHA